MLLVGEPVGDVGTGDYPLVHPDCDGGRDPDTLAGDYSAPVSRANRAAHADRHADGGGTFEPLPAVRITEFTRGLHVGDTASVIARTPSGVPCSLYRTYRASEGGYSFPAPQPIKVGTQVAGADGVVGWRWLVDPPVGSVLALVEVECGDGAGIAFVTIRIWPDDLTSSTTLPPALLGTWAFDEEEGCCGVNATFVLGPCSLGERCGSLVGCGPACVSHPPRVQHGRRTQR